MSGDKVSAIAPAVNFDTGKRLFLHADLHRTGIVGKNVLEIGGLFTAGFVDAVEAAGVSPGIIVEFQAAVIGNF